MLKNSSRITVQDNHVSRVGNPVDGETAKGIRVEASTDPLILRNTVANNTTYGIYLVKFVSSSSDNVAVNNVTYQNGDHGIDDLLSPSGSFFREG